MRRCAQKFIGAPYAASPLGGSPSEKERFSVDLKCFDCVTFVETILAVARSKSKSSFINELKAIRYRNAEVEWKKRLHYFTDWIRSNVKRGALRDRSKGEGSRKIETRLALIEALPQREVTLNIIPKNRLKSATKRIENGTVIAFASLRTKLDYFHVGLLFWEGETLTLYHATKSKNGVVSQPLEDFLKHNRMRGFSIATPR